VYAHECDLQDVTGLAVNTEPLAELMTAEIGVRQAPTRYGAFVSYYN
jgi:hypothetical protein